MKFLCTLLILFMIVFESVAQSSSEHGNLISDGALLQLSGDNGFWKVKGESFNNENLDGLLRYNFGVAFRRGLIGDYREEEFMNNVNPESRDSYASISDLSSAPPPTVPGDTMKKSKGAFGLQAGVDFIGKGATEIFVDGESDTRLDYVEMPVYFFYAHHFGNALSCHAGAGGYLATCVGARSKNTFNGQTTKLALGIGKEGSFTRFDLGPSFMAGVNILKHLNMDVRFDLGIVDVENNSSFDQIFNRSLSLNLGYFIALQ